MIAQAIIYWVQGQTRVVVDVPLLYESGLDRYMSYVIALSRYV
jgi:hypothetical protein